MMLFAAPPIALGIGPAVETPHHRVSLDFLSTAKDGFEECEMEGCAQRKDGLFEARLPPRPPHNPSSPRSLPVPDAAFPCLLRLRPIPAPLPACARATPFAPTHAPPPHAPPSLRRISSRSRGAHRRRKPQRQRRLASPRMTAEARSRQTTLRLSRRSRSFLPTPRSLLKRCRSISVRRARERSHTAASSLLA